MFNLHSFAYAAYSRKWDCLGKAISAAAPQSHLTIGTMDCLKRNSPLHGNDSKAGVVISDLIQNDRHSHQGLRGVIQYKIS